MLSWLSVIIFSVSIFVLLSSVKKKKKGLSIVFAVLFIASTAFITVNTLLPEHGRAWVTEKQLASISQKLNSGELTVEEMLAPYTVSKGGETQKYISHSDKGDVVKSKSADRLTYQLNTRLGNALNWDSKNVVATTQTFVDAQAAKDFLSKWPNDYDLENKEKRVVFLGDDCGAAVDAISTFTMFLSFTEGDARQKYVSSAFYYGTTVVVISESSAKGSLCTIKAIRKFA